MSEFNYELFQNENFESNTFINKILEKQLDNLNFKSLETLNLHEFNEYISKTIVNLQKIHQETNDELNALKLEQEWDQKTSMEQYMEMKEGYVDLKDKFEKIEGRMFTLAQNSIEIGKTMQILDEDKNNQTLIKELIQFFNDFNIDDIKKIPDIFRDKKQLFKAAKYIHYLQQIAKNITASEYNQAIINIKMKYIEIQQNLFYEFTDSYYRQDFKTIQIVLPLIEDFNKIALFYINNALRSIKSDMHYDITNFEEVKKLVDDLYFILTKILKSELGSEDSNFYKIFGNRSLEMIKLFISYIFDQYIGKIMQDLLTDTKFKNLEYYLKYYDIFYERTNILIRAIYKIESRYSSHLNEIGRAYFINIFEFYENEYFSLETKLVDGTLSKHTKKMLDMLENQKKHEAEIIKNNKSKVMNFIETKVFFDRSKLENIKLSKKEVAERITLLQDLLMQESIEVIFKTIQISSERCSRLSKPEEKNPHVILLLDKFINYFGKQLLYSLVTFTTKIVPHFARKSPLNENYYEIISKLNGLVQRMEIVFVQSAKYLVEDKDYIKLVNTKEQLLNRLETTIQKSILDSISSLFLHGHKILSLNQNKEDFCPRESINPTKPTKACQMFVSFLQVHVKMIKIHSSEANRQNILASLGLQLLRCMMDIFSEIKVTPAGSMQLAIDLDTYSNFFHMFEDQNVIKEFNTFKALTNVLLLKDERLKKYIADEPLLKNVPKALLDKYCGPKKMQQLLSIGLRLDQIKETRTMMIRLD